MYLYFKVFQISLYHEYSISLRLCSQKIASQLALLAIFSEIMDFRAIAPVGLCL